MKVLLAGESHIRTQTDAKGVDSFTQTFYMEEAHFIRDALKTEDIEMEHMSSHLVPDRFPFSVEDLKQYDTVMISDVGANSFTLGPATTILQEIVPNRLQVLEEYVKQGGGFCMIGGYLTFMGFEGKGAYHGTAIEKMLPVEMMNGDDRNETPEGAYIEIEQPQHPIFLGFPAKWPPFLGYNKLKAKPGTLLASHDGNAFISVWDYGQGRSMAFASDCAPHWAPKGFLSWEYYSKFWCNAVRYLAKKL